MYICGKSRMSSFVAEEFPFFGSVHVRSEHPLYVCCVFVIDGPQYQLVYWKYQLLDVSDRQLSVHDNSETLIK